MDREKVVQWLIKWFADHVSLTEDEVRGKVKQKYLSEDMIDSFAFIELIADIEENFDIEFDNDMFEDRSFSTIEGLADIIVGSKS